MVGSIDPCTTKPGGTRSYILSLIRFLEKNDINTELIGVKYNANQRADNSYKFIPIVYSEKISSYKFLAYLLLKCINLNIPESAIIHTHRPDDMFPFVLFFRKNKKICTLHGIPLKAIQSKKGYLIGAIYKHIEKYTLKRINKIISVDEETKRYYIRQYPWISDKITVIPVGVDTCLFRQIDKSTIRKKYLLNIEDRIIIYIGRMENEKNINLLLKAFKQVKEKIKNCKLILVGNGRKEKELKNFSKELGLKDVTFMETMNHLKIPEILNCADVFALCSIYEGMPTVVIESLACGVPVVSTKVGDVHKVVKDGVTGYIVNLRNEEEICDKLIRILQNCDLLRLNCIRIADEYSWEKVANRIIEVYDEIQK